jgi:hypothetical protein
VLSSADHHKSEVVNDESTSEWKGGGDRFLIGEGVARNIGHVTLSAMWAATLLGTREWRAAQSLAGDAWCASWLHLCYYSTNVAVVAKGKLAGNAYKCIFVLK